MFEEFIKPMLRALVRNPARAFSMAMVGIIAALVMVHIVAAPAPERIRSLSRTPASEDSREPGDASLPCVTMPDGAKVCDAPEAAFNAADDKARWACGFAGPAAFPHTDAVRAPAPAAVKAVEKITESVGLAQNFFILEGDFKDSSTAYALFRNQMRFIVYDGARFHWKETAPNWREIVTMAHEIGHHLNGHTLDDKASNWPIELEADRFAGFAVSRLGGSLESALGAYRDMSEAGSKTHPPRSLRLNALETGWRHAERLKQHEALACSTDWLGKPVAIGEQSCRMASLCDEDEPRYRIACEAQDGSWLWR